MTGASVELESLLQFLDATLGIPDFPDYEGAANGLQVEGSQTVQRVGAAVDASVATIEAAAASGVDLLLVHHGLFWEGLRPLTGRRLRRVVPLVRHGISLYSAHLPLDAHEELGNAAQLIGALGLTPNDRFGRYEGRWIGFTTEVLDTREAFRDLVSRTVEGPVKVIPGGPNRMRAIGVVTGGGGGMIREAAEAGLDGLLTGEGAHHTFLDAMELGVNLFYAGHYATETWGVRALAARLQAEFGLPWEFIDVPSGL